MLRITARRSWVGAAYAAPTASVTGAFFLVPLLLVGWMSLHDWPLLGMPELNVPANYTDLADNELLSQAAWFTLKYTVIITVLVFTVAFGLALLVQHKRKAPLILLNSTDQFTLTLAVVNMRTASHGAIDYAALEAGVMFMAVPCVLLFLFLQRGYVRGFMSGALKG